MPPSYDSTARLFREYAAVVALEWSRTDATEREFDDNAVAVRVTFRR